MRNVFAVTLAVMVATAGLAGAHELRHSVTPGNAVIIELSYADATPFDFEQYEIYRDDGGPPFQVGRTDAHGRIAFIPDETGTWRLKAFSEDGHGVDFTFEAAAGGTAAGAMESPIRRYSMILVGVALILGIFGLLSLFVKRRIA
jgi:nickel transport protein